MGKVVRLGAGVFSPEAGMTWPGWNHVTTGSGPMATVRWDVNPAFENSAMRVGTILRDPDGNTWVANLYTPGDANQGIILRRTDGSSGPSPGAAPPPPGPGGVPVTNGGGLSVNYQSAKRALQAQGHYRYYSATQTGTLPDGKPFRGPETAYLDTVAQFLAEYQKRKAAVEPVTKPPVREVWPDDVQQGVPVTKKEYITPVVQPPVRYLPGGGSDVAAPGGDPGIAPASDGVPTWLLIVGAAAVAYFVSRR